MKFKLVKEEFLTEEQFKQKYFWYRVEFNSASSGEHYVCYMLADSTNYNNSIKAQLNLKERPKDISQETYEKFKNMAEDIDLQSLKIDRIDSFEELDKEKCFIVNDRADQLQYFAKKKVKNNFLSKFRSIGVSLVHYVLHHMSGTKVNDEVTNFAIIPFSGCDPNSDLTTSESADAVHKLLEQLKCTGSNMDRDIIFYTFEKAGADTFSIIKNTITIRKGEKVA